MKCPKCRFENPEQSVFCGQCGESLEVEVVCLMCGWKPPPGFKFCNKCGHDLKQPKEPVPVDYDQPHSYTPKHLADKILTSRSSIEGERKIVTVLFADVVNYTSICEKLDPEQVHQIMDGCFKVLMEEIHKHEGTVNQFTGDGVMALFGAPVAHEDHARRACYAALSIQKAIAIYGGKLKEQMGATFTMRVGLNSGPVIVGVIGDDLRMDYTAVGDTTNLAARMENLANPGSVLVSHNTYRLVRDFFEFEPLGEIEVKGKEKPQKAYLLKRTGEVTTRIEASIIKGLSKFVGREEEVLSLTKAFERARSGDGQVVGIVGEAGVGKSRLSVELKRLLPRETHSYYEGRCLHYGSSMSYLPVLDILKSYFQVEEEDSSTVVGDKMERKLLLLNAKLENATPPLQDLLSLKVADESYLQLDPERKRSRTFEAVRDLFIRESERKPMVLVVEDLHWIDQTSEEFLNYFIEWVAKAHILLILLYRPEYTHKWGSKSYYSKIGVNQLSTRNSIELIEHILGNVDIAPELGELILSRSGGNPLFVEELTHSLLENGFIKKKDNQYILTMQISDIEVPDTIQGIISARIDRLEENLKKIMQEASVIGREFAFSILQMIAGMTEDLKTALLRLQGLEFIYEKRLFPELQYTFKHALTQEVAYNSLLYKRKRYIHEKIGRAIEELYAASLEEYYALLAFHYELAEISQKSIHYLILAADRARRIYANDEAIAFYRRAGEQLRGLLSHEGEPNRQWLKMTIQIDENLGDVLKLTARHAEACCAYESALARIGEEEPILRAHLHRKCANVFREQRRYEKALYAYDLAETALGPEPPDSPEAWWRAWLEIQDGRMWVYYWQAQLHQMAEVAEKVRPAVEQYGTSAQRGTFYQGLLLFAQRRDRYVISEETLSYAISSLEATLESGNLRALGLARFTLGFSYLWRGDLDEAEEYLRASLNLAKRMGDVVIQSRCLTYLTILYRKRGRIEKVRNYISEALAVATAGEMLEYISTAKANLAWVHWREGDLSKAREYGRTALDMWRQAPLVYPFQWTALWPLIGVAVAEDHMSESVDYARMLLEPSQQRLPDALETLLRECIAAWDKNETEATRSRIRQAVALAGEVDRF